MKHLIATLIFVSLIQCLLSELQTTSNCGTLQEGTQNFVVPTKVDMCTRVAMTGFKSCCYVNFNEANKANICVSTDDSEKESQMKADYIGEGDGKTEVTCPKPSDIPNSCGVIGMMEPIQLTDCSAISIPESYCCWIEVTKKRDNSVTKVCRRLDEFPNKDSTNSTIITELADYGTIKTITCHSSYLTTINSLLLIVLLIALYII